MTDVVPVNCMYSGPRHHRAPNGTGRMGVCRAEHVEREKARRTGFCSSTLIGSMRARRLGCPTGHQAVERRRWAVLLRHALWLRLAAACGGLGNASRAAAVSHTPGHDWEQAG